VTGPNIASQGLLFQQLSVRLKEEINGPIVTLRSGDASNLKAVLKQLIRDSTNQRSEDEDLSHEQDVSNFIQSKLRDSYKQGRKLLNYDLEILHGFVKNHGSQKVVVAFQDSEAFDTNLVVDLITLFR
jgi:origin recognition complex subunit 3